MRFPVEITWSGRGRDGAGRIEGGDAELEYSVPASMGGSGSGTNPEELLVSAVGTCYSATLYGALHRAGLPATGVHVQAVGTVTGYPEHARFAELTVSPTITGADAARAYEYEQAAQAAHDRCFIGGTIAAVVDYRVGRVTVEPAQAAA